MYWTVNLNVRLLATSITLDEATERVLSALLDREAALGPVTYAHLSDGSVGARFDLEAPDFEAAIANGLAMFTEALEAVGLGTAQVIHGEALKADPVPDEVLETAPIAV